MAFAEFSIDPQVLAADWTGGMLPVGVIDLDAPDSGLERLVPPPFPVIGVGDATNRLAQQLDCVVEPPASAKALIGSIRANPHSAAICVQTLRNIESLPMDIALHYESVAYGLLQASAEHADWLRRQKGPAAPSPTGAVRLTREGASLHALLDRPDAHNAIDRTMRDALCEAFTIAVMDPEIRRVTLRGAGRSFSMGADLAEFGTTRDPATAHMIRMQTLPAHTLAQCSDKVEVHIKGGCVGSGLEMAAFAGRITASANAWFQLPELAMGIMPGAGGCVSVPRRIGRQRTALMILSGKRINAETALDWGLVDAIIDD